MNDPRAPSGLLEAAARAAVSRRCRSAYLHELRGELQALSSAVELLVRLSRAPAANPAAAEKAAELARRALAGHERSLISILDELAGGDDKSVPMDLGELADRAVRLLRGEASRRSIELRVERGLSTDVPGRAGPDSAATLSTPAGSLIVAAPALAFRRAVNGLSALITDALGPGATLTLRAYRRGEEGVLEWRSGESLSSPEGESPEPGDFELALGAARRWVERARGRVESDAHSLRLVLPLAGGTPA